MDAYKKIKLKISIINVLFEISVDTIIFLIAYFYGKILETLFFYVCWRTFRFAVPKIFHIRHSNPIVSILGCGLCSCFVFFLAIRLVDSTTISLFSSILLGIGINLLLYKAQDYLDLKADEAVRKSDIYSMNEEELRKYAKSKKINEQMIDTLVLRVIHNYKWIDIEFEKNFTKEGIRYHKEQLNKKLGLKL